jgi:spore maturation protein A
MIAFSLAGALFLGNASALAGAVTEGAQSGVTLAISMAGAICLWSGVGALMEKTGISRAVSRLLRPILRRLFPSTKNDPILAGHLSANVCANLLGLGNAATPMGIRAAQRLASGKNGIATNELCRLIVLNTASIQLIPANVAAIRASMGCATPFDILPAVWVTSLLSAGAGVLAAWVMGKVWPDA